MSDTLVLNLFGGPGTGKSTTCAGVFAELKLRGVNCEMALEYAKDRIWEDSRHLLDNQISVFGEQYRRIRRLVDKVDIVISDSPLLNSILYYRGDNPYFTRMVYAEHGRMRNMNVYLERVRPFDPAGRYQDEQEAHKLDSDIERILAYLGESSFRFPADKWAISSIADLALMEWQGINEIKRYPDREDLGRMD